MTEPDIDQPGKPLDSKVLNPDGTVTPHPVPQTKRQNLVELATATGGFKNVTDEMLRAYGLTRPELAVAAMDFHHNQKAIEDKRQGDEILYGALTGPPRQDEYIRWLKLLMPDDWQKHVPDE
jgi:hypothetical protein